jgi:hypothetical protein
MIGCYCFVSDFQALKCPECGKFVAIEGNELERFEALVAKHLALAQHGSKEALVLMIRVVNIDLDLLGNLLAVEPDIIVGWQDGRMPIEQRVYELLALIVLDRSDGPGSVVERLHALRNPKPLESVTRICV